MQSTQIYKFPGGAKHQQEFDEFWAECCENKNAGWIGQGYARWRFNTTPELYFRKAGWVYVLANPFFIDEIYKVGRTTGPIQHRIRQLRTTGVPGDFDCLFAAWFSDCVHAEALIHELLDQYRVDPSREFFNAPLSEIKKAMRKYQLLGEAHPDHMIEQAYTRWRYAVNHERVNGVLVACPDASEHDFEEVPF